MAGRKLVIYVSLLSPVPAARSDIIIKNNILVLFLFVACCVIYVLL